MPMPVRPLPLSDTECLALVERGTPRHPLDRALLLAAVAEPGVAWADRPLGLRDACLMGLRSAWFGPGFDAVLACPACTQLLSLRVDLRGLAERALDDDTPVLVAGARYRRPTTRDLAALVGRLDVDDAAAVLLQRLALDGAAVLTPEQRAAVEAALDAADPLAHVALDVVCEHCQHGFSAPLDIAVSLWDDLAAQAERVVDDVHTLAGAYGWNETEILAMSAARRALYKQRVWAS